MIRPLLQTNNEQDELFEKAVKEIIQYDRVSPSLLQRRLSIGYARAARILEMLESAGVVGPSEGSRAREVLIHTAEELFGDKPEEPSKEEENLLETIKNYKVPTGVKLTIIDKTPWGKQFGDVLESEGLKDIKTEFPIPIGYDEEGKIHIESLPDLGNLIIAGNSVSQKENLLDTVLLTYLLRYSPRELRLILIDETHYLDLYNGIPHLFDPVINNYDRIIAAYRWSLSETLRRMKHFTEAGVRDLATYNKLPDVEAQPLILMITNIPYFYDEATDILTILSEQCVRAGIHNIIVASRANSESLPRNIKSNIPARIVFKMTSAGESKAIDVTGAEKLEPGEIIYKPNYGDPKKLNALFTPEVNVKEVVEAVKRSVLSSY